MNNRVRLWWLLSALLVGGCTLPPRTSLFPPPPEQQRIPYAVQLAPETPPMPPPRVDTIYLHAQPAADAYLPRETPLYSAPESEWALLEEAIQLIEQYQTDAGCDKLQAFLSRYPIQDSAYYEAKYYEAECMIQHQRFAQALTALRNLNAVPHLPSQIHQKVLVRIGQLYCVLKQPAKAEQYFTQLKTLYPNSPFRRLANCDFLRNQ